MSDPNSFNINMSEALTSSMILGLKPAAPRSRSYRASIPALNKAVFSPGDQIIIEIPTNRKGTWLDQSQSYFKFSVQAASTVAATAGGSGVYLDNSAYCFIQRLDVINSSNLCESINEYGQLANYLIDTSLTKSDKEGMSALMGTNPSAVYQNTSATYTQYGLPTIVQSPGDRSGMSLSTVSIASGINSAIPYTFSLPLLSGVVGINASKMLPIGKLLNPIRLEIYLASNDDAIYYGTAAAGAIWQLINVEFVACFVEIQDGNLDFQTQQGIPDYISTTTYKQASTYLPATTSGEWTCLVPFRANSLTALYTRFRPFATSVQGSNATAAYRKSASINCNLSSFYYKIGGAMYPNKPVYLISTNVGTGSEAYGELLKSFHALSSTVGNTAVNFNHYNVAATALQGWSVNYTPGSKSTATVDTHANAFSLGLELETFSNRSDTILSGISTQNSPIYFTGTIYNGATCGGTAGYNYTVDFFAQMDMILIITDGVMSAKY